LYFYPMGRGKTPVGRESGAGTEDGYFELCLGADAGYWFQVAG